MAQFYYASSLSENIDMTPEGFLICKDVAITRSGDFLYGADEVVVEPDSSGVVKMWRSTQEVTSAETIASFEGKPLTLLHPDDEVTPDNYSDVTVGTVQNVRAGIGKDMDKLIADLIIMEKDAIAAVMSRDMREISVGFSAEQIQISPGMGVQRTIRGNHVAIVPRGRAGHDFAIKDSLKMGDGRMGLKDTLLKSFGRALDEALPKDAEKEAVKDKEEATASLMERISGLEDAVSKMVNSIPEQLENMMKMKSSAASEESANSTDHISHDSETMSNAEILAPGINHSTKDLEMAALNQSYGTEEGRSVIDSMLGKRGFSAISKDSALKKMVFVATAEILKARRSSEQGKSFSDAAYEAMKVKPKYTPEERNKMNKEFYNRGNK